MITAITQQNRATHRDLLASMFRMRAAIVQEEWGWKVPGARPGWDEDQFDRGDTVYLLVHEGNAIEACVRLNTAARPHMMTEVFPHCVAPGQWHTDGKTFELSRYVIDQRRRGYHYAMGRLELAMTEACLMAGVERLTWLSHMRVLRHALSFWRTRTLGLPTYFEADDRDYVAAVSDMTPEGTARVLRKYRFGDEVLTEVRRAAGVAADGLTASMSPARVSVAA